MRIQTHRKYGQVKEQKAGAGGQRTEVQLARRNSLNKEALDIRMHEFVELTPLSLALSWCLKQNLRHRQSKEKTYQKR